MSKGPATIRDVAKAAKVSAATVSRHLNKSIVLPPETARRIEKACARLAYRPNALAKRLSLGASQILGLLAPEIANPFFAALAAAAEAEARRHGYSLLIMSSGGDASVECEHIDRLASRDVDGLIVLTSSADDGRVRDRIDGHANVILVDEDVPGANVSRIFVENEQGAYEATRHLIAQGHEAIAHVGGPADLFSTRERHAGFARAMAEAGLSPLEFLGEIRRLRQRGRPCGDARPAGAAQAPDRAVRRQRLYRHRRLAGPAPAWPGGAGGAVDRRLRRHAVRRIAASAADHRAPADRRDGQARRADAAAADARRNAGGRRDAAADATGSARLGGEGRRG